MKSFKDHQRSFVAFLNQAIAPVIVASLAVEDGLNHNLLPVVRVQGPPELFMLALIAAFRAKRHISFQYCLVLIRHYYSSRSKARGGAKKLSVIGLIIDTVGDSHFDLANIQPASSPFGKDLISTQSDAIVQDLHFELYKLHPRSDPFSGS